MPALGTPGGTSVMFPPSKIAGLQEKSAATGMGHGGCFFLSLWEIRRTFGNRRDMKMNIIPFTHPLTIFLGGFDHRLAGTHKGLWMMILATKGYYNFNYTHHQPTTI